MKLRVGLGFDTHQLVENRPLWLGGVHIPHSHGALGHSDADVLLHAICDALLGAANLRDIGYHFSNKDPRWKGIDSKILLKESYGLVKSKGYYVENIDATLILEAPKINPYVPQMQATIAAVLEIEIDAVSIKATTNETMGYVGRQEGVNALATCLLIKS